VSRSPNQDFKLLKERKMTNYKITQHLIDRFVERTSMSNRSQVYKIIIKLIEGADCLFDWVKGSKALRTPLGIIVIKDEHVAVTYLDYSDLKKYKRKEIQSFPSNLQAI
jgi:hypothetical protein